MTGFWAVLFCSTMTIKANTKEKKITISLTVDAGQHLRIVRAARRKDWSVAKFMRHAALQQAGGAK